MADQFHFSLVSPERELVSADVDTVVVPGSEGDFGVLPGHASIIANMRPGILSVTTKGATTDYFVYNGFAEVTATSLAVLAEEAMPMADLRENGLGQRIKDAQEDVASAKDEHEKAHAQEALDHLKAIDAVLHAA